MSHESASGLRSRLLLLFILTLHSAVLCYAIFVQQVKGDELRDRGTRQGARKQELSGHRGVVMDAAGRKLAMDLRTHSVYAVPRDIKNKNKIGSDIAKALGLPPAEVIGKLKSGKGFVWVKRYANDAEAERIKKLNYLGVGMLQEMGRVYPKGESAAAVVGIKGMEGGMEGVEFALDDWLKGEPGYVVLKRDAGGRTVPFSVKKRVSPRMGSDVYLSIDMQVQYFAEAALEKSVTEFNAAAGSVIVMRPKTGEIVAMAGYPSYDPNRFHDYDQMEFRNRPVWRVYEPGSVFKPIIAASAFDAGVIDPYKDQFYCEPSIVINRRRIGEHESHGLPAMKSMKDIIAQSYNTGSARVALKLGSENVDKYLRNFNFGSKFDGLQLKGQEGGLLPPKGGGWKDIRTATIGYGQGIGVTTLQVATAFAAIANGGILYEPSIVKKIVSASGETLYSFEPKPLRRVLGREASKAMRGMLHAVVEEGTGTNAKIDGYTVGGKTGTAKVPGPNGYIAGKYISSFVGFAPLEDPEILTIVVVEYPWPRYYAGDVAAPAFSEITRKSLWHYGIPPSYERREEKQASAKH